MKEITIERKRIYLNPAEKGTKYCHELHEGVKFTNEGAVKTDNIGNAIFFNRYAKSISFRLFSSSKRFSKDF